MIFPQWHTLVPHLPTREMVRGLEPEYSLLFAWHDKAEQWREQLRPKIVELLGLQTEKCSLDIRDLDTVDCGSYTRTKIAYNVEEGLTALAWVCVPRDNQNPLPAVICTHRRGPGKDEVVGLVGEAPDCEHLAYAAQLAERGYVTLAPDARCFGERPGNEAGLDATGTLLGRPLLGMQVSDLIRAVDYLAQRPEVKPHRIGITGAGMGAMHAVFAAAIDERIACTAVCGGLSTYREMIVARDCFTQCKPPADMLPGLLRYADVDDVACLVAPRPLMMVQADADRSVPLAGAKECLERVRAGFETQGERIKAETVMVEGSAAYHPDPMFRFLDDWLKLPEPGSD